MTQAVKETLTKKFTPGLFTLRRNTTDEMNEVKDIILRSLEETDNGIKFELKLKRNLVELKDLAKNRVDTTQNILGDLFNNMITLISLSTEY